MVVPPKNGGGFCPHMSEAQLCPRLPCNDIPVCPVSEWTEWSHCTSTCGKGKRLRSRQYAKVTKVHMTSLIDCSTTHLQETTTCTLPDCRISEAHHTLVDLNRVIHCPDAVWSEWGSCSQPCGVGVRTREQIRVANETTENTQTCHLLTESKKCHGKDCKKGRVNCKMGHWSTWGPCSATCGADAARSRFRKVTRPARKGGEACPSDLFITEPCDLFPCPTGGDAEEDIEDDERCLSADGTVRSEGERWSPVECLTCTCTNQRKTCQLTHCPPPQCEHPQKIAGFCCYFCDNF